MSDDAVTRLTRTDLPCPVCGQPTRTELDLIIAVPGSAAQTVSLQGCWTCQSGICHPRPAPPCGPDRLEGVD